MCVFGWTGLEGYMLYRAVIVVFDTGSHRTLPFYLLGYGLSSAVAIVTVVIGVSLPGKPVYHQPDLCWLSDHYIYGFIGPIACVLLGNLVMLVVGARAYYKVSDY